MSKYIILGIIFLIIYVLGDIGIKKVDYYCKEEVANILIYVIYVSAIILQVAAAAIIL